eukprot:TRINITY_DN15062_c0_g1_i1.p1 TRINITY_DN15062_c0_g1~~TRINITY_DN15062_c0_g1_i1.p1  ORF type:complete len:290 (-),score=63.82 TRINITY_DN15062_c0_g1_i1:109-978(-)
MASASAGGALSAEEKSIAALVHERSRFILNTQRENDEAHDRYENEAHGLIAALHAEAAARRLDEERIAKAAAALQEKKTATVYENKSNRADMDVLLARSIEERIADARGTLHEQAEVTQTSTMYSGQIRDEICRLYASLEELRRVRAEKGDALVSGVKLKLQEIRDAVEAERRIRLESEKSMLDVFAEVGATLQKSLQATKADRVAACERIFQVMEGIVPKLDEASRHAVRMADTNSNLDDQQGTAGEMAENACINLSRRVTLQQNGKALLFRTGNNEKVSRRKGSVVG